MSPEGTVVDAYARILPGAAIDHVVGIDIFALGAGGSLRPKVQSGKRDWWGSQFAAALLDYHRQDSYAVLEVVDLAKDDPWRSIYAACLGLLPQVPTPELLNAGHLRPELTFEDFLHVDRVQTT